MMEQKFEKIKNESKQLSGEVKEKTLGYILTALGLVAGLAWNDAIKAVIENFIKAPQNSIFAKLFYAVVITIVVVVVSVYLARLNQKNKEE